VSGTKTTRSGAWWHIARTVPWRRRSCRRGYTHAWEQLSSVHEVAGGQQHAESEQTFTQGAMRSRGNRYICHTGYCCLTAQQRADALMDVDESTQPPVRHQNEAAPRRAHARGKKSNQARTDKTERTGAQPSGLHNPLLPNPHTCVDVLWPSRSSPDACPYPPWLSTSPTHAPRRPLPRYTWAYLSSCSISSLRASLRSASARICANFSGKQCFSTHR